MAIGVAWRAGAFVLALALAPVMVPRTAHAAEPSEADRNAARDMMTSGDAAFTQQRYGEALRLFEAAHQIMQVPTTGIAVAQALHKLGRLLEAQRTAQAVAQTKPIPDEPPLFAEARESAVRMVADLDARIPTLRLQIEPPTVDATLRVTLDETIVPTPELGQARRVDPGRHVVTAEAPGYHPLHQELVVDEREQQLAKLSLVPIEGPSPKPEPPPPDASTSPGIAALLYGGFGVGVAGLVVGIATGATSLSQTSDIQDQCIDDVCPTATEDDAEGARTLATVADVSFVVAGAGVGAGIVGLVLLLDDEPADEAASSWSPWVGYGQLGVRGRF